MVRIKVLDNIRAVGDGIFLEEYSMTLINSSFI
jgi:hypothetical protein